MFSRFRKYMFLMGIAVISCCTTNAFSIPFDTASPLEQRWGVHESSRGRFVLCEISTCPERSIKHLYVVLPPAPQVIEEPIYTEPMKVNKPPLKNRRKGKKKYKTRSTVKYQCKPIRVSTK